MDAKELRASAANSDAPPAGLAPPVAALWWIAKGGFAHGDAWHKAHGIAQTAEGDPAHDWVHALLHRIEGDESNAGYWYRRAGKPHAKVSHDEEWDRIAEALLLEGGV